MRIPRLALLFLGILQTSGGLAFAETVANNAPSWQANPAVVKAVSKRIPQANFFEDRVPAYTLPDPLVANDGRRVSKESWSARRQEILELFREHVYGQAPVKQPQNFSAKTMEEESNLFEGKATRRLVEISFDTPHAGRFSFPVQLFVPKEAPRPMPAVVLLQFRGLTDPAAPLVIEHGYCLAILDRTPIAADDAGTFREGVINAFSGPEPLPDDAWRAIGAWAWGASRVVDYLETVQEIDARRIGVAGHSRMGKTALWAGASDERFSFILSNNSGCGGAALSRRAFGETVSRINTVFPHWFCANFHRFNNREAELPIDQHMLIAAIAPRAVYVTSADEDLWADPRGEFLSCVAADPVYQLLGFAGLGTDAMPALGRPIHGGRLGYHIRKGSHALTGYDWQQFLQFAASADQPK